MNKNSTEWVAFVWPGTQVQEPQVAAGGREGTLPVEVRPADNDWDAERWDGLA